jgi:hypothetical protein
VRIARISSGFGTGVAVGIGVGVAVRVGVSVGAGEAVAVCETAGVGREADWPAPHAEKIMESRIAIELQVNTLFIFIRYSL